jgi:hypothetical protein
MRFRRTLAVAMASAAAAIGIATSVGLPTASARADTTSTSVQLPISKYSHMLLDPAHQHIFFTGGSGSDSILVTDYSGNTVATIPNEPGATGLALSDDGSTVYAALTSGDAVSAISTSTLTETARYATGSGTDPTYVAYTSGKIWFGYGSYGGAQIGIGSIDPGSSPATVTLNAVQSSITLGGWAPMLAASPNGELVAYEPEGEPAEMATFDVSSGTATVLAPAQSLPSTGFLQSLQITPDGRDVVTSSGQVFRVSDLSADGDYSTPDPGNSVSIASDGTVAVGTTGFSGGIWMFAPGGSTPLNTYYPPSNGLELAPDGVALTPDASELFAVTVLDGSGDLPTLNIVSDPAQVASAVTVYGPPSAKHGTAITITGTLTGIYTSTGVLYELPYTGGQTLTVTRFDPADPNGAALPDVTTAADGSFSFTDTPPKANADTGTVTYQVSYAGNAHLSASSGSTSVPIQYNGS